MSPTPQRPVGVDRQLRHVEENLSHYFSPNTHLTGEALGLLYLGSAWPDFPRSGRWMETGWSILLEQLPIHLSNGGGWAARIEKKLGNESAVKVYGDKLLKDFPGSNEYSYFSQGKFQ